MPVIDESWNWTWSTATAEVVVLVSLKRNSVTSFFPEALSNWSVIWPEACSPSRMG